MAPPFKPIAHGTVRGYAQEYRRGIGHCGPCTDANSADRIARRRAQDPGGDWQSIAETRNQEQAAHTAFVDQLRDRNGLGGLRGQERRRFWATMGAGRFDEQEH
jgi:hypothetical protein